MTEEAAPDSEVIETPTAEPESPAELPVQYHVHEMYHYGGVDHSHGGSVSVGMSGDVGVGMSGNIGVGMSGDIAMRGPADRGKVKDAAADEYGYYDIWQHK